MPVTTFHIMHLLRVDALVLFVVQFDLEILDSMISYSEFTSSIPRFGRSSLTIGTYLAILNPQKNSTSLRRYFVLDEQSLDSESNGSYIGATDIDAVSIVISSNLCRPLKHLEMLSPCPTCHHTV